jgi:hypothetical protein
MTRRAKSKRYGYVVEQSRPGGDWVIIEDRGNPSAVGAVKWSDGGYSERWLRDGDWLEILQPDMSGAAVVCQEPDAYGWLTNGAEYKVVSQDGDLVKLKGLEHTFFSRWRFIVIHNAPSEVDFLNGRIALLETRVADIRKDFVKADAKRCEWQRKYESLVESVKAIKSQLAGALNR